MSYNIVHCSISENGNSGWDGKAKVGDQTGRETCVRSFYSKPWEMCLRYKDSALAKKAVEIATKLANSNLVGYDQSQRNTLYKALQKNNWDVDKYIKSGVKTEADCSAFMYAIWCCILPELRGQSNAPRTATAKAFYSKHGFNIYTDKKYLVTGDNNKPGDMLNKASGHIVMFASTGKNVSSSKSGVAKPNTNTKLSLEAVAKLVLEGKYGNGDARKRKLEAEGYNYKEVQKVVNKLSAASSSNKQSQPTLVAGLEVNLFNVKCYTASANKSHYCIKSGKFFLWSDKVVNGKVMITNSKRNVGVKGQVTCWITKEDALRCAK